MKFKLLPVIITAAFTSVTTIYLAAKFQSNHFFSEDPLPVNYTHFTANNGDGLRTPPPADFQNAAESSVQAVVHIKTQIKGRTVLYQDPFFGDDFFGLLFGSRQGFIPPQTGSGSGVVISPDGYIVTNYHVVSNADEVTVTFNDRYTKTAKIVAKDASADIAVLKVDETNLPYMEFGNSDDVKLGQWVLAVGYPLTLDATVTAGIVSAKSRSIGINRTQSPSAVESFIQTDAAVNPGNSGGALVNTSGQLIGINSAIASPTGSYAGYSYAIPANIVKKVVNDLIKYGAVQRAYLGIGLLDRNNLNEQQLKELGADKTDGVYAAEIMDNSGAKEAGLKRGDFITRINNIPVRTETELLEQVAHYKPGDHVSISYIRDGKTSQTNVELKNVNGTTSILKKDAANLMLGATLRPLNADEKRKFGIQNGVVVTDISEGIIARQTGIKKGFVITNIDDKPVNNADDIQQAVSANNNKVQIAGFYPGNRGMYYYGLDLSRQ